MNKFQICEHLMTKTLNVLIELLENTTINLDALLASPEFTSPDFSDWNAFFTLLNNNVAAVSIHDALNLRFSNFPDNIREQKKTDCKTYLCKGFPCRRYIEFRFALFVVVEDRLPLSTDSTVWNFSYNTTWYSFSANYLIKNGSKNSTWAKAYLGYPKSGTVEGDNHVQLPQDMPAKDVFAITFGEEEYEKKYNNLKNACATRVSLALIAAGKEMMIAKEKDYNILIGENKGKPFITTAHKLQRELSKPENLSAALEFTFPITMSLLQSQLSGKNGIYILISDDLGAGVTGHATLWVDMMNNVMGRHHYADRIGKLYFWELT